MRVRWGAIVLLAAACGGCAGPGPGLTGDKYGGIIPWSPANQALAFSTADAHCAVHGKLAQVTSVFAQPGHYIAFACVFPPGYVIREQDIVLQSRN